MKKKSVFFFLLFVQIVSAQTTTVIDHRTGKDTAKKTTIIDHRIPRDMSPSLVRPAFEEMPVYRIQLRITTAKDNGTDDRVWVQLNETDQKFYLAKEDNFNPGSVLTYDIINAEIKKLNDLRFIKFGVVGDDGVCFTKLELLINNCTAPIYYTQIVSVKGTCFDNGNSNVGENLVISYNNLRNHPAWSYAAAKKDMWRPCTKITKDWIVNLVEAAIGNQMIQDGSELKWGSHGNFAENNTLFGKAVEAEYKNNHTLKVDLDLERDLTGPNAEANVNFELDFRCNEGVIEIETQNITVTTDLVGSAQEFVRNKAAKIVGTAIAGLVPIAGPVAWFALKKFLAFRIYLTPATPGLSGSCKKIEVTANGEILLQ